MRIKITADSTCDLSEELLAQWDIALMPMHILMGEDSYLDGVTIHPADVFAYVNAGGKMPKSAAANLVEYTEFFEPFAKECDAVIHISVSSKLSSCFQNAKLAAGEFENVYVVDSQNICTGQGYLVLKAAKWAADGLTPRNITMRLQSLAKRVELSFVLDRLDFMAKSGRCSGVLAFGANLLGIKPALEVIDGELKVVKKYRGSLPICVGKYITNHSTGKMGYALARAAAMRGADVTLIHGETALQPVKFTTDVPVTTAQQMYEAVTSRFDATDVLIMAAAVADYRPAAVANDKIKKKDGDMSIPLERTPDILGTIGPKKTHQFLCGFSMETRDLVENSSAKLTKKNLDMVVANNLKVAGAGFGVDTNVVTLITPDGTRELPLMSKADVADAILDEILKRRSQ